MVLDKVVNEKEVTITNRGMITIPAAFRKNFNLKDGDKVLIIEDETEIAKALKIRLESEGYQSIIANDGEEGWNKLLKDIDIMGLCNIVLGNLG